DGVLDGADLGEAEGQGEQSLLSARAVAPEVVPADGDGHVIPVRSHQRLTAAGFIAGPRPDRLVKGLRGRAGAQGAWIPANDRAGATDLLVDPRHLPPQQLDPLSASFE